MKELLKSITRDIVNTVAWLRLCSPDEPLTMSEWALQALTCLLRLAVAAAIFAATVYFVTTLASGQL